jgi:hypothetical protein
VGKVGHRDIATACVPVADPPARDPSKAHPAAELQAMGRPADEDRRRDRSSRCKNTGRTRSRWGRWTDRDAAREGRRVLAFDAPQARLGRKTGDIGRTQCQSGWTAE